MIKKFPKLSFFSIIFIVTIFSVGFFSREHLIKDSLDALRHKDCKTHFTLIDPEPGCELYEEKLQQMTQLQNLLEKEVNQYLASGKAKKVSIFSRDLMTRRFVGVNEVEVFQMASLLKVPLAVAYYKIAEISPEILEQEILYTGEEDLYSVQYFAPDLRLDRGKTYTVSELISRALVYSDNTAAEILADNISREYLDKNLIALSLRVNNSNKIQDLVTAKSYANIFRSLYNSSFLTREYSNEILELLTKTKNLGAARSIPEYVTVAHKFGERSTIDIKTKEVISRQFHDCGIVYAKNGKEPYSFCIMTEGQNFEDLQNIAENLSLLIYKELVD